MPELALATPRDELLADCRVASGAARTARLRFDEQSAAGLEGCAHHLARLYNIIEQMALRVAKAFENQIEDESGWHSELIRRLSIAITGLRPTLFSEALGQPLRELRAFRHEFTHACDLELDRDKLALLLKYARQVESELLPSCEKFISQVASQEGLGADHR
jgi:hypothetical protein